MLKQNTGARIRKMKSDECVCSYHTSAARSHIEEQISRLNVVQPLKKRCAKRGLSSQDCCDLQAKRSRSFLEEENNAMETEAPCLFSVAENNPPQQQCQRCLSGEGGHFNHVKSSNGI